MAKAWEIALFAAVIVATLAVMDVFGVLDDPLGGVMRTFG